MSALQYDYRQLFSQAMAEYGIAPEALPKDDGELHRFDVPGDKNRSLNGWYVLYGGKYPAGAFGCWKRGIEQTWSARARQELSHADRLELDRLVESQKEQARQAKKQRQQEAARRCQSLWQRAKPFVNANHTYLVKKQAMAYGIRQLGSQLLVPVIDGHSLVSLQFIDPDGNKRFKAGGKKQGCYHLIGKPNGKVYLCEGYATGSSIHQATGDAVAVAFDAGNLLPVAKQLLELFPTVRLIVAADNDITEGKPNPGIETAESVSEALGVEFTYPELGYSKTDFNDVRQALGLLVVRHQLTAHLVPAGMTYRLHQYQRILNDEKEVVAQLERQFANAVEYDKAAMDRYQLAKSRIRKIEVLLHDGR